MDLAAERRNGEFLLAHRGAIRAAADLSDGGLALAAFEMAEAAGIGLALEPADTATLFGEDQARYLVACAPGMAEALIAEGRAAGVPVAAVGRFGGDLIRFGAAGAALGDLSALYRGAFAAAVSG